MGRRGAAIVNTQFASEPQHLSGEWNHSNTCQYLSITLDLSAFLFQIIVQTKQFILRIIAILYVFIYKLDAKFFLFTNSTLKLTP